MFSDMFPFCLLLCCSSEMAATSGQTLFREKEIWLCGCSERGHATWACAKNHQGSWWHDKQEISSRQEGLPWVSTFMLLRRQLCVFFYTCSLVTVFVAFLSAGHWNICPMQCSNYLRICPCLGSRSEMFLCSTTLQAPFPL